MSEYEALRTEIERMGTSYVAYAAAIDRYAEVVNEQVAELWADNAALRDELHAVANRLEALTRGLTTDPAEVAAAMVAQPYPVCVCGHRYDHHRHHGVQACYTTNCRCRGYEPQGNAVQHHA